MLRAIVPRKNVENQCFRSLKLHHIIAQVLLSIHTHSLRAKDKSESVATHVFRHPLAARSTRPTMAQQATWIFGTLVDTNAENVFVHTGS
jgi:hypothetical protein